MHEIIKPYIEGVIVPLITPYYEGEFDEESFIKVAQNALKAGVNGLFVLGNTGEFRSLQLDVKRKVIDVAVREFGEKTKILAGITCDDSDDTDKLAAYSKENKVHAVVLNPAYQTQLGHVEYVERIAGKISTPILLYENPGISNGRMLTNEEIISLSQLPKVIGIKLSYVDFEDFKRVKDLGLEDFLLFQGHEDFLKDSIELGINGVVGGTGNIHPGVLVKAYKENEEPHFSVLDGITSQYGSNMVESIKKTAYDMGLIKSAALVTCPVNNIQNSAI